MLWCGNRKMVNGKYIVITDCKKRTHNKQLCPMTHLAGKGYVTPLRDFIPYPETKL